MLVIELFEDVGLQLLVLRQSLEDLLALLMRCGLDQIRDLGRMQTAQAPRPQLQSGRRNVPDKRLHISPRNELRVLGVVPPEAAWPEPVHPGPEGRVDPS